MCKTRGLEWKMMTRMEIIVFGALGLKVFSCPINCLWSKARDLEVSKAYFLICLFAIVNKTTF